MKKNPFLSFVIFIYVLFYISCSYSVYVIGISGLPGSGKSTLAKYLANKLNATYVAWDAFAKTSTQPKNPVEWFNKGANFSEFKNPDFKKTIQMLKQNKYVKSPQGIILTPTKFIIVEAPIGRMHLETSYLIDKIYFVNTDPITAYKRQTRRDNIKTDINIYNKFLKNMYESEVLQKTGDVKINGNLDTQEQADIIIKKLNGLNSKL
jgi:uridine kinase